MKQKFISKINVTTVLFFIILAVGIFARVYKFGSLPGGINQDEAYAGYEAYSLLHYGKDSFGYSFPVYFISWGSGMNVLESYLMIPFIAMFGLETWVIRLPQLIMAIITLVVVYLLMKRLFNEKAGLISMFILAVVPWHIMLSRWGLESNLAPAFLVLGLLFFIKGMDKQVFYIVSAIMYGLSLYAYATIWPFVPVIILLEIIYAAYKKKANINKYTIISCIVLAVMALPLFLFLLVNKGYIDEIRLGFISIPKLLYMRSGEISLQNIPDNFKNIWNIMLNQTDGLVTNVYKDYGIFYKITLVLFVVGMVFVIYNVIKNFKSKNEVPQILLLIQFIAGFLLTLMVTVNVNRANSLMIPVILIAAYGLYEILELTSYKFIYIAAAAYLWLFGNFIQGYFQLYNEEAGYAFCTGLEEAMDFAMDNTSSNSKIYITPSASHSRIMFYSKIPVDEYIDTVVYNNYPSAFMSAGSFGRFCMDFDLYNNLDTAGVYILDTGVDTGYLVQSGFKVNQFGYYIVAYK